MVMGHWLKVSLKNQTFEQIHIHGCIGAQCVYADGRELHGSCLFFLLLLHENDQYRVTLIFWDNAPCICGFVVNESSAEEERSLFVFLHSSLGAKGEV